MATTYLACDGTITSGNGSNSQAKSCSTGWQSYTPPEPETTQTLELSGELITLEQGRELFSALAALFVVIAVYRGLCRIF